MRKGSVLIIVLLVLFFLSALALNLAGRMRSEVEITKRYIDRSKSLLVAKGALALVLEEMENDRSSNQFDYPSEPWLLKFQKDGIAQEQSILDFDRNLAARYKVLITDEMARINPNKTPRYVLEALLAEYKGIDSKRLSRAIPKKLESIYQLLGVKGMEERVFWGEDLTELGLEDLLTIHTDGRVNLNTASLRVLNNMPGVNRAIVKALVEAREKEPFKTLEDIKKIPLITYKVFTRIASWATVKSDLLRIDITAQALDSKVSRRILAIVDRSADQLKIKYWRED